MSSLILDLPTATGHTSITSDTYVSQILPILYALSLRSLFAAPYIPPIDPSNASDTQNFDEAFLDMDPIIDTEPEPETQTDSERERSERDETETPSRSPQRPVEDDGDVFDGYSFKGRHSVILDDPEDDGYDGHVEDEEGEDEEEDEEAETAKPDEEPVNVVAPEGVKNVAAEPEVVQDEKPTPPADDEVIEETPPEIPAKEVAEAETVVTSPPPPPPPPAEPTKLPAPPPKPALKSIEPRPSKAVTIATPRPQPRRREKSGVPALDRHLSRVVDEDEDVGTVTERDDDDWDFVETPGGEDRNGAKGTSLFARGVVDRYRLAVFRKASSSHAQGGQGRSFSGLSVDSDIGGGGDSSPSSEKRRGRNTGLSIGKSTRQFLRARSPPSTFSSGTRSTSRTTVASSSQYMATGTVSSVSSGGLLTPSQSMVQQHQQPGPSPHSLKSKDSTTSMGSPSGSSDGDRRSLSQSAADVSLGGSPSVAPSGESSATENGKRPVRTSSGDEPGHKLKKMKKYKEGAEKVLSLFGSPRQERAQPSSSQS